MTFLFIEYAKALKSLLSKKANFPKMRPASQLIRSLYVTTFKEVQVPIRRYIVS